MQDVIQNQVELTAPVSRVWQALSNSAEFGAWFRVNIEGPFEVNQVSKGHITYPGYEHIRWEVLIKKLEPEHTFGFTWHPYAVNPTVDYSQEASTYVEFNLIPTQIGTRLCVSESGFHNIPKARQAEAFEMNAGGWTEQMKNIQEYLATHP